MTSRRTHLQQSAAIVGLLAATGLFPQAAMAAFTKAAFDAKTLAEAYKALGVSGVTESKDVTLTAPDIAENGAVVPLGVATALPGVKQMLLLVEKNPNALVALFHATEGTDNNFLTRAKLGQSSDVIALALMTDGRALFAKKEVKVTLGGCGG